MARPLTCAGSAPPASAVILAPVQVTLAAVAVRDSIGDPAGQQFLQLRPAVQVPYAAAPGAARDHRGELVHHLAEDSGQLVPAQVGGEQPDAARDVETTPPGDTTPPPAMSVAATPPIGNP